MRGDVPSLPYASMELNQVWGNSVFTSKKLSKYDSPHTIYLSLFRKKKDSPYIRVLYDTISASPNIMPL
jgi:hypothetical protein